ncbi:hypothetical protein GGR57DRAFT_259153 [Xylariaceae sp. FL1272]|nr:hypothetical protein GGR57DRAFT_259153 [Xylariaceae sp. FL1272]
MPTSRMSYSAAVRREIYLSWKPVFLIGNNSQLRKKSKIRDVVNDYAPTNYLFWHPNLINILRDLLERSVFTNEFAAADMFPDLFSKICSQPTATIPVASSDVDEDEETDQKLMDSLLYYSGEYSDLIISCGERRFRAHKALICPRSDFFAAACRGDFKENHEGIVDLPDDDPRAVEMMVYYFYHFRYDLAGTLAGDADTDASPMPSALVLHVLVYAIAEKYNIQGLKAFALEEFKAAVTEPWDTDVFLEAAREAYLSTVEADRGLRDIVVATFSARRELLDQEKTQEILKEVGLLAYDLLMERHRDYPWG